MRVTTTILLALTFVNVTLSAMFLSAHDFSQWLNKEMPQPIYAQERRLIGVIRDSLEAEIRKITGKDRATGQEKSVETSIANIDRTGNAGVILLLDADVVSETETEQIRQLQTWNIEADRWGRIVKMSKEGTPRYIAIEKIRRAGNGAIEPDEVIFAR